MIQILKKFAKVYCVIKGIASVMAGIKVFQYFYCFCPTGIHIIAHGQRFRERHHGYWKKAIFLLWKSYISSLAYLSPLENAAFSIYPGWRSKTRLHWACRSAYPGLLYLWLSAKRKENRFILHPKLRRCEKIGKMNFLHHTNPMFSSVRFWDFWFFHSFWGDTEYQLLFLTTSSDNTTIGVLLEYNKSFVGVNKIELYEYNEIDSTFF